MDLSWFGLSTCKAVAGFKIDNNTYYLHLYTVKGRHQWTIDNFLHRAQFTEVGDSLCSPVFAVPVDVIGSPKPQELLFQLEVFPNGKCLHQFASYSVNPN